MLVHAAVHSHLVITVSGAAMVGRFEGFGANLDEINWIPALSIIAYCIPEPIYYTAVILQGYIQP